MSEPVTRLLLIRHAEPRASVDGVVAGHQGCRGLTELGRAQARALRDRSLETGELAADVVLTSLLPRAIETAELLAPALGEIAARRDCDLCELHPGECDGLSWQEYRRRYAFDMLAEPDRPMSPGGESLAAFQARVEGRILRLVAEHPGRTSVLVCHGGVINAATLAFMEHGMHRKRPFRLDTGYTSITEWVRPAEGPWVLARYNDTAHLSRLR